MKIRHVSFDPSVLVTCHKCGSFQERITHVKENSSRPKPTNVNSGSIAVKWQPTLVVLAVLVFSFCFLSLLWALKEQLARHNTAETIFSDMVFSDQLWS